MPSAARRRGPGSTADATLFKRVLASEDASGSGPRLVVRWFNPLSMVSDTGAVIRYESIQCPTCVEVTDR
jgi:hypothetical protein